MQCRFATLATAILIGGAFMVGHANAQYYRYPPNSPYAQPPYGPPRYAMPPDMDDDYPMYDPREDGGYSPLPPRSAAGGPQGGPTDHFPEVLPLSAASRFATASQKSLLV